MVYQKFRFLGDLIVVQQYKKGTLDVEYDACRAWNKLLWRSQHCEMWPRKLQTSYETTQRTAHVRTDVSQSYSLWRGHGEWSFNKDFSPKDKKGIWWCHFPETLMFVTKRMLVKCLRCWRQLSLNLFLLYSRFIMEEDTKGIRKGNFTLSLNIRVVQ